MFNFDGHGSPYGAQRDAAPMHPRGRLTISGLVFAAALTCSSGAHSIECRSEKGDGYPWAWRQIDGKRCWYKGKPGMDKKLLRWAEGAAAPPARKSAAAPRRSPSLINDYAERERLLQSYWPPLSPADVTNGRSDAGRAKRL